MYCQALSVLQIRPTLPAHIQYELLVPTQSEDEQHAAEATHLSSFRVEVQVTPQWWGLWRPKQISQEGKGCGATKIEGGHPRDQQLQLPGIWLHQVSAAEVSEL